MQYPLSLRFKILALAPQVFVADAQGQELGYVHQKLFKLKEVIEVWTNSKKEKLLYSIKADRIIDFSAVYSFFDGAGTRLGAVRRKGRKSLWKAHYEVVTATGTDADMLISEEDAWIKVLDALLGQIPILGLFTGYFLNPSYLVTTMDKTPLLRVKKQPAFFEGKFEVEKLATLDNEQETRATLSILMMTLLERARG